MIKEEICHIDTRSIYKNQMKLNYKKILYTFWDLL